jgi:hypothetical protein
VNTALLAEIRGRAVMLLLVNAFVEGVIDLKEENQRIVRVQRLHILHKYLRVNVPELEI